MKIFLLLLVAYKEINAHFIVKTKSKENCQAICDLADDCEAWTFDTSRSQCFMKHRYGWTHKYKKGDFSGLKNHGPAYEADTDFEGGDLDCIP